VFGGSFNPPHFAHQTIITWLLSTGQADSVWMVPCWRHMFGKRLAPFRDRLAMCEQAAAIFSNCSTHAIEGDLKGRSIMLRTIQTLKNYCVYKEAMEFSLVIGMDNWLVRDKWEGFDQLEKECRIIVVGRNDQPRLPDIRSTTIRNMLAAGEDVSGLVPAGVLSYIKQHRLYFHKV
jgi:nicotinate-nucleotide adenylyltransferase